MSLKSLQTGFSPIKETKYGYYVDKKLGEGYGGTIYEGVNIIDCSSIAVKILNPQSLLLNHIEFPEMVKLTSQNQIKLGQLSFQKNSLVKVFDVIQLDKPIIIMQLCDCNLSELLYKKGFLNQKQLTSIFKNIVEALLVVEKAGFHFSDLKPQNILISQDGQAKLGDLQSLIKLDSCKKNKKIKFHNSIFGTLRYMAPQLIGLGSYCHKNYIWTLGVILHELIYKAPPFKAQNYDEFLCEDGKQKSVDSFYESLFNIQISQSLYEQYPIFHELIKKMLRLSVKNRISLQDVYKIVIKQREVSSSLTEDQLTLPLNRRERSGSEGTADTSADQKSVQVLKIVLSSQNNCSKTFSEHKIYPSEKYTIGLPNSFQEQFYQEIGPVDDIYSFLREKFLIETQKLIELIGSPLILVKKLNEMKHGLSLSLEQLSKCSRETQTELFKVKLRTVLKSIKQSRAFSHLEKTVNISTSQKQYQRNFKEIKLWIHLNEILNIINQNFILLQN